MTTYYDNHGVLRKRDEATDDESVKSTLKNDNLCIAVIEDGENIKCIRYGKYEEQMLIHNGKAYFIN